MYVGEPHLAPDLAHFAVAAAAWINMKKKQSRHVWLVPPGLAKTKILLSLVYVVKKLSKNQDIHVRFPSNVLKDQNSAPLRRITDASTPDGIHFQTGVSQVGRHGAIELVDDVDLLVFDHPKFDDYRDQVGLLIGLSSAPLRSS